MAYNDDAVLGLSIAFPIVAIASVVFRFEARRIKRLRPEADDWFILAALVFDLAVTVTLLLSSELADVQEFVSSLLQGAPVDNRQYTIFQQTTYISYLFLWLCVGLTKISVLLLYRRIFVNPMTGAFRTWLWCSIWLVFAWTVAMTFTWMFTCLPIATRWDPTNQWCSIDEAPFYTAALVTDVITDGLILLLPVYKVQQLRMPVRRKLAVIGIFGLGALVTITGIIRLQVVMLAKAHPHDALNSGNPREPRFVLLALTLLLDGYNTATCWSIIESNVGILSACLPTLSPLYEGYRINTIASRFASLGSASRSATTCRDNIRLNSLDQGFSNRFSKVPRGSAGDPFPIDDDSNSSLQRP